MRSYGLFLLSAIILALNCLYARAADEKAEYAADAVPVCRPGVPHHVLGGHALLPSGLVPPAFADSESNVLLGFAEGTVDNYRLGAFEPAVQAQGLILPGLALNGGFSGNILAGLNTRSIVEYGASTSYAFQFGALYELIRRESDLFSVALDFARPRAFSVSPLEQAADAVRRLVGTPGAQAATRDTSVRWVPSLRYAHTFIPALAAQAATGLQFDNTADTRWLLGVGLSFDFNPLISVPIGLTAGYRRAQPISSEDVGTNNFSFGVFETIGNIFNFGAELGRSTSGSQDATIVSLLVRVYYN